MAGIEVIKVEDAATREQAFAIRRQVFVHEQEVPEELEFDDLDAGSVHLLALAGERPVGTLRVRFPTAGAAKIERVAVVKDARGLGIGRRLIARALDLARAHGACEALLHAQVQAERFYGAHGFEPLGATFIEDGIPHVAMRRRLRPACRGDAA